MTDLFSSVPATPVGSCPTELHTASPFAVVTQEISTTSEF